MDYAFTTTLEQDRAIAAKRQATAPDATDAAFVEATIQAHLSETVAGYIEQRVQIVADAYRTATADQRLAADKALGL